MALMLTTLTMTPVFATDVIKGLVTQIWTIFKSIGYLLGAWGVGQLILAFKNEDADSKSKAVMLLVAAAALMNLETIFTGAGFSL